MRSNRFERCIETACRESMILRQFYARLEPELGFAGRVLYVDMSPRLFPGEEVEPVASDSQYRRTHGYEDI